jgi:aminoglycoside phosphotransferase (APT) family kinase protein
VEEILGKKSPDLRTSAGSRLAWLESHVPDDLSRLVTVHGDARQDDVMIKGGTITVLLDWEYVHAGDAAEDLEYTRMRNRDGLFQLVTGG